MLGDGTLDGRCSSPKAWISSFESHTPLLTFVLYCGKCNEIMTESEIHDTRSLYLLSFRYCNFKD